MGAVRVGAPLVRGKGTRIENEEALELTFFLPDSADTGFSKGGVMPKTRSLPSNPNLEKLKKQAKTLLRDFRKKEPEALKLVASLHTGPDSFDGLRDAQLVVARQHGFDG